MMSKCTHILYSVTSHDVRGERSVTRYKKINSVINQKNLYFLCVIFTQFICVNPLNVINNT